MVPSNARGLAGGLVRDYRGMEAFLVSPLCYKLSELVLRKAGSPDWLGAWDFLGVDSSLAVWLGLVLFGSCLWESDHGMQKLAARLSTGYCSACGKGG